MDMNRLAFITALPFMNGCNRKTQHTPLPNVGFFQKIFEQDKADEITIVFLCFF